MTLICGLSGPPLLTRWRCQAKPGVVNRIGAVALICAATLLSSACSLLPPTACPGALLTGRLADSDGVAVVIDEFGPQSVTWPDGYSVDQTPELVLRDPLGRVVASEGDTIYIGGGQDPDDPDAFRACGHVSRDPP